MSETTPNPTQPRKRGRPFAPGQSGNPDGRRLRCRNPSGEVARIMGNGAAQVARKMVALALAGDVAAARLVLESGLAPAAASGSDAP